jgi:hypothetical protein
MGNVVAYASSRIAETATAEELKVSAIVAALEQVWNDDVRRHHPQIPNVAMVVASGAEGLKVKRWGHWAAGRWVAPGGETRGEVLIAAERLAHGPIEVLGTLLHEAAHALAHVRGIGDTSRQGRYHNDRYRQLALELGLRVDRDDTYGWTITRCSDATVELYRRALDTLEDGLRGYRADLVEETGEAGGEGAEKGKGSGGGKRLLIVCGCPTPRKLRISPATLDEGDIFCGVCGEGFRAEQS